MELLCGRRWVAAGGLVKKGRLLGVALRSLSAERHLKHSALVLTQENTQDLPCHPSPGSAKGEPGGTGGAKPEL